MKPKQWLAETHGAGFELVRHFLGRFFDSDLVTEPGQWTKVLVTGFSLLLPSFHLLAWSLSVKYRHFSRLPTPDPYRHAVRADELWLIMLTMSVVGLLTAIQWQSLFPTKRDYLALATLPIRPRQIFTAKFIALLVLISGVIAVLNAEPSLIFPLVSSGHWQINPSIPTHILVHASTCAAAGFFCFFALLALQGILLNLFRPAWFARVTSYTQAAVIAVMLSGIVFSFSIGPATEKTLLQWESLPPIWFLGLYQVLLGDTTPIFRQLADRAVYGLSIVIVIALLSYLISYRRHRRLAVEGLPTNANPVSWGAGLLDLLIRSPRRQAILTFITKTLTRSGQHRIVLVAYFGLALALAATGIAGMRVAVKKPDRIIAASFTYAHMVLLIFTALGLRRAFGLPSELSANWTFQITELEGRDQWLQAVDLFVTLPAIFLFLLLPAPLEVALMGWQGIEEPVLLALAYLVLCESLFHGWQKLPFTCSYVPGQGNGFIAVARFAGVLSVIPVLHLMFVDSLYKPGLYTFLFVSLTFAYYLIRRSRRDSWNYTPLRFDEETEPAIRSLNLGTV